MRKDLEGTEKWVQVLDESEIHLIVKYCAAEIDSRFEGQDVVVACILKGAAYFHVDLTRALTIPHSSYFIEASSYKDSQTQSDELEILSVINPEKFQGKKVVLIDELFDNGKTLSSVKAKIAEKAHIPLDDIFTCVAFKKNKETSEPAPDLCGKVVPDVWLVGYGLDDKQTKRNWTSLYAVPKSEGLSKTADDAMFDNETLNELFVNNRFADAFEQMRNGTYKCEDFEDLKRFRLDILNNAIVEKDICVFTEQVARIRDMLRLDHSNFVALLQIKYDMM